MQAIIIIKKIRFLCLLLICSFLSVSVQAGNNADLDQIKTNGRLRHLGVPYANFVTGADDGFSIELIQKFAEYIGVDYVYVKSSWSNVIPRLVGKNFEVQGNEVRIKNKTEIKGDVIANGLTILKWRKQLLMYSEPIFPTQVWLIAKIETDIKPIQPSSNIEEDITMVRQRLQGHTILGKPGTCLAPELYKLKEFGAIPKYFRGTLNQLAPAILNNEAEATVLDVPDALIALQKWGGKIKIIGPISPQQDMGVGFRKSSPKLLRAFNNFLKQIKENNEYLNLVKKYYPNVFSYFPKFFE